MSYAIFRTQKIKATVLDKCQRHNQRENKNYSNKDIDFQKTRLNYDLHNNKSIDYKGKKAVRKDAVLNVECLITSDSGFFKSIGSFETSEKLIDEYRQERDYSYNKYNSSKYEFEREKHYIRLEHAEEIEKKIN